MIDINKIKYEFKKYVSNYDPKSERIKLKISHIVRVANNCKLLAQNLNLTEEEISLAEAIGYFHDIGRFEQVRIANTFSDRDSKINHGEYGAKILFEDGLIRNFIEDNKYDEIVKTAIINHNRPKIESNISEKEMLFSKIIRDADKLDILYVLTFEDFPAIFWYDDFDCEKISDSILEEFKNHSGITYNNIKNNADQILIFYAYIYDLNFKYTLDALKENKHLDMFTKRVLENFSNPILHKQMKEVERIYKDYLG